MVALTAAVILVGTLCVLDMLMTFGVVRRLREHADTLEELARRGAPGGRAIAGDVPPPGRPVGDFRATSVDGATISSDVLAASYVAVFLAADCTSCREQVPELVGWAAAQDRHRVLVVIDGKAADPADLVAELEPVATVVVETPGTPVTDAFGVTAFPSFCVVGDAQVVFASLDFTQLPAAATA